MTGVVVGRGRTTGSSPAVSWGAREAVARGLPLTLLHAWSERVDVAVDLPAESLPDLPVPALSAGRQGRPVDVLADCRPDVLVLGRHPTSRRMSDLASACARRAICPVVVVPDGGRSGLSRVLVGSSLGRASRSALLWAAQEADMHGAELVVAHVWQLPPRMDRQLLHRTQAKHAEQPRMLARLHRWVLDVLGPVPIELLAVHGAPLDVLLDLSTDADLVVLGHSTSTGVGRAVHCAVRTELAQLTSCPVAVIPQQRSSTQQCSRRANDPQA